MLRIGFTGTREEKYLTRDRKVLLFGIFQGLFLTNTRVEFHHGDCIGADQLAQGLAQFVGFYTVSHPPEDDSYRAFTKSDLVLPVKPYIERNHDIVDACDILIATPKIPNQEELRSGTWATIRYAHKLGKEIKQI